MLGLNTQLHSSLTSFVFTPSCITRQAPGSDAESEPNRYPIRIRTCGGGSDPNPNLARRNRSESEPGPAEPIRIRTLSAETDPNPNSGKLTEPNPNPDPNPAKREASDRGWDSGVRISVKVQFRRKWRALPYREPAWNQKNQDGEHKERCTHQHTEHHGYL